VRAHARTEDQSFQAAALIRVDGAQRREVLASGLERRLMNLDKNPDGPHIGTFEEQITITASVGPFLFVRDYAHEGACGAHGLWGTDSFAIDVRNGERAILSTTDKEERSVLEAASATLHGRYGDPTYGTLEPQYAGTEPRIDAGGVHMFHTFMADVPFAFGASPWRSYAVDVEVPAAVPPEVAPFADVPPIVGRFAAAHPDLVIGGFTRVEATNADRLRVAFAAH
jgi:hypothetical protein